MSSKLHHYCVYITYNNFQVLHYPQILFPIFFTYTSDEKTTLYSLKYEQFNHISVNKGP
jgi:hypothetical protein